MLPTFRKIVLRISAVLGGAALLLIAVIETGAQVADGIATDARYFAAVTDIECNPPPDQDRSTFLREIHYYGRLPEKLHVLDAELPAQLASAFAEHPRVKSVAGLSVLGGKVRVEVVYRDRGDEK